MVSGNRNGARIAVDSSRPARCNGQVGGMVKLHNNLSFVISKRVGRAMLPGKL